MVRYNHHTRLAEIEKPSRAGHRLQTATAGIGETAATTWGGRKHRHPHGQTGLVRLLASHPLGRPDRIPPARPHGCERRHRAVACDSRKKKKGPRPGRNALRYRGGLCRRYLTRTRPCHRRPCRTGGTSRAREGSSSDIAAGGRCWVWPWLPLQHARHVSSVSQVTLIREGSGTSNRSRQGRSFLRGDNRHPPRCSLRQRHRCITPSMYPGHVIGDWVINLVLGSCAAG